MEPGARDGRHRRHTCTTLPRGTGRPPADVAADVAAAEMLRMRAAMQLLQRRGVERESPWEALAGVPDTEGGSASWRAHTGSRSRAILQEGGGGYVAARSRESHVLSPPTQYVSDIVRG